MMEEEDGFRLNQSQAIIRYLARKTALYGANPREASMCDMIADGAEDVRNRINNAFWNPLNPSAKDDQAAYVAETLPRWLSYFDRILRKNNNNSNSATPPASSSSSQAAAAAAAASACNDGLFFVGDRLTYVDFVVFDLLDYNLDVDPSCLDSFPLLSVFHSRIAARPRIAAYLRSDRRSPAYNYWRKDMRDAILLITPNSPASFASSSSPKAPSPSAATADPLAAARKLHHKK